MSPHSWLPHSEQGYLQEADFMEASYLCQIFDTKHSFLWNFQKKPFEKLNSVPHLSPWEALTFIYMVINLSGLLAQVLQLDRTQYQGGNKSVWGKE